MSQSLPERADMRQLRTQAKELLEALRADQAQAVALAATHDPSLVPAQARLADAQRLLAREYGYTSWPDLVEKVEVPQLLERFRRAIDSEDPERLEKLLKNKPLLRKHIDDPISDFDSPAIVRLSGSRNAKRLLPILVEYGADPNIRSSWWAGGFSALDGAEGESVDLLIELGAKLDVWSASAHARADVLETLLNADPSLVNAPGGDGKRPLHFAANAEIAELLLKRGADPEIRDVDHESTAIQYQVKRPDVLKVLLEHGATPDVFTFIALDDADGLREFLRQNPKMATAQVGEPPFATETSNGGHIYLYHLGPMRSPALVAAEMGSRNVLRDLSSYISPAQQVIVAAWTEDREAVQAVLREHSNAAQAASPHESAAVSFAAQAGRLESVRLLLEAGFDPKEPGMDSGSALHVACWFGYADIVRMLIPHVDLELRDVNHGSTPLGWATHGSRFGRRFQGEYVPIVEALIQAGADVHAPANGSGDSLLVQAGDREDVKDVLRRYGAQ